MQEGYDGLLRDKTRPSRIQPLGSTIAERVVLLTQSDPPTEATHWTSAMVAKVVDISASSVQRIWRAHGLQPHRVKQFKLSTDPQFVDKLRGIVSLYVDPPAMPSSSRSMRRAKSRRSTAASRSADEAVCEPVVELRRQSNNGDVGRYDETRRHVPFGLIHEQDRVASGATVAAISARCRFIASVQAGRIRAAPLPRFGQTTPKM